MRIDRQGLAGHTGASYAQRSVSTKALFCGNAAWPRGDLGTISRPPSRHIASKCGQPAARNYKRRRPRAGRRIGQVDGSLPAAQVASAVSGSAGGAHDGGPSDDPAANKAAARMLQGLMGVGLAVAAYHVLPKIGSVPVQPCNTEAAIYTGLWSFVVLPRGACSVLTMSFLKTSP